MGDLEQGGFGIRDERRKYSYPTATLRADEKVCAKKYALLSNFQPQCYG